MIWRDVLSGKCLDRMTINEKILRTFGMISNSEPGTSRIRNRSSKDIEFHYQYEVVNGRNYLTPNNNIHKYNNLTFQNTNLMHNSFILQQYTECPRRNVKYFGSVFLMLNYTDITQNTYIKS